MDVPLSEDYSHDLEAMRERVDARTGLVYICNPHNPTGSLTRRQDIDALLQKLPPRVVSWWTRRITISWATPRTTAR